MSRKRIMLVASAGGHWVQLLRLSPAFEGQEKIYVTTMAGALTPDKNSEIRVIPDASRSSMLKIPYLAFCITRILISFRPDFVITTGAMPGLLSIQLAKIIGCRTVWIDSLANSEELSWSGKIARRYADLWLTQWPHVASQHPDLKYHGSVL